MTVVLSVVLHYLVPSCDMRLRVKVDAVEYYMACLTHSKFFIMICVSQFESLAGNFKHHRRSDSWARSYVISIASPSVCNASCIII